jgi:hypothetical protein
MSSTPQTALLRMAHLSGDAGPLDLCVRTSGTMGWPDGLAFKAVQQPAGLTYPQVSNYVVVPAGTTIDIRAAVANTDCTALNKVAELMTVGPFVSGKYYTVGAVGLKAGSGAQALALAVYKDDVAVDPAGSKVRFIHAAPAMSGAVDVVSELKQSDPRPTVLFSQVAFGKIADVSLAANVAVSIKGYAVLPSTPADIGVRLDSNGTPGATDTIYVAAPPIPVGGSYTVFAIGAAATRTFICADKADMAATTFAASCVRVP